MDLGFFSNRVLINSTFARNRSSNQLLDYGLPSITGQNGIIQNFPATVQNTSWEFVFSTINIKTKEFNWTSAINFTIPRNKLLAFPTLETSTYAGNLIIGQPLNFQRVYHFLGVDPAEGSTYLLTKTAKRHLLRILQLTKRYSLIHYLGFMVDFKILLAIREFNLMCFFR